MRGTEERRQLGENQMNVGGSGDRLKDSGISLSGLTSHSLS